jgi:hypothetical protein
MEASTMNRPNRYSPEVLTMLRKTVIRAISIR